MNFCEKCRHGNYKYQQPCLECNGESKYESANLPEADACSLLADVADTEWIIHARTLKMEDVLECYINEIEEITCEYDCTEQIKKQLKELLKIYAGNGA